MLDQFILWNPNSAKPPKKVFVSADQAKKTALWASNQNPNQTFYICKLTSKAIKGKIEDADG